MQAQEGNTTGLAASPTSNILAIATDCGELQLWDYQTKKIILYKKFTIKIKKKVDKIRKNNTVHEIKNLPISSISFSRSGKTIGKS